MKRTVGICIFCGLILIGVIYVIKENQKIEQQDEVRINTENPIMVSETEDLTESMNVELPYEYVILEKDGYLVVYEADGKTVYFESDIQMKELENSMQKEILTGKKFKTIEEVYDFLENYSS